MSLELLLNRQQHHLHTRADPYVFRLMIQIVYLFVLFFVDWRNDDRLHPSILPSLVKTFAFVLSRDVKKNISWLSEKIDGPVESNIKPYEKTLKAVLVLEMRVHVIPGR